MTFTVGLDCEGFIKRGNEYIPAVGLIGGTKKKPRVVEKGALQEDNVMFEINVEPATDPYTLYSNILIVISQLEKIIKDQLGDVKLVFDSQANFSKKQLISKKALEFGCDKDYNVYTERTNVYPDFRKSLARYSGGHIHIGHPALTHPEKAHMFIKHMDLNLIPYFSLAFSKDLKKSNRYKYYGTPGNFRYKPYGIEYRSLSSHWITSREYVEKVFNAIHASIRQTSIPTPHATTLLKHAYNIKDFKTLNMLRLGRKLSNVY